MTHASLRTSLNVGSCHASSEGRYMVCYISDCRNVNGDNWYTFTNFLPRWTAIINTWEAVHIHAYTHTSRWLLLGWMTTKEDHPRLRIAYTSYIMACYQVLLTYLLTYLKTMQGKSSAVFAYAYAGNLKVGSSLTLLKMTTYENTLAVSNCARSSATSL